MLSHQHLSKRCIFVLLAFSFTSWAKFHLLVFLLGRQTTQFTSIPEIQVLAFQISIWLVLSPLQEYLMAGTKRQRLLMSMFNVITLPLRVQKIHIVNLNNYHIWGIPVGNTAEVMLAFSCRKLACHRWILDTKRAYFTSFPFSIKSFINLLVAFLLFSTLLVAAFVFDRDFCRWNSRILYHFIVRNITQFPCGNKSPYEI